MEEVKEEESMVRKEVRRDTRDSVTGTLGLNEETLMGKGMEMA